MMLRSAILALAVALVTAPAAAQDALQAGDPGAPESGVDFILRPTEDATGGDLLDDIWGDRQAPAPEQVGSIGPPLAGPTADDPVGPELPGPISAPAAPAARPPVAPQRELDPFAAVGNRLGTFIIRPAIEIGVSVSDNPGGADRKESAVGIVVAPELSIISEDDAHAIAAVLRGEMIFYGDEELDERDAEARIRFRRDLPGPTSLEGEAGYAFGLERFTDPDTPTAAAERPAVHSLDAALGVTREVGWISAGLRGTVDREVNEDVPLADGGTASREELDNTEYGVWLRTTYGGRGGVAPFVDAGVGRRDFDQEVDNSGFRRASVWGELRGGLIFDLGSKLNGEISAGWRREDIEDERLEDIDAATAAAAILWSPRRLTDVRLNLRTEFQPTSIADASGSVLYSGTLSAARRLSARLRAEAGGGLAYEDFVGLDREDVTFLGFGELSYSFNRSAAVVARYTYERTDSSDPGLDEEENAVSLRIRLQR